MTHYLSDVLVFLALLSCGVTCVHGKSTRPNIIFILADDLGWNDVSFHGSKQIPTPNLDGLASSGITLDNYYVQPICTPTRSAIMTGRHPIHTGMQHGVIVGSQPYGLPLSETIMPQYFKKLGYATHIVGKWHLGFFAKEYTPPYRGFDSFYGYWLGCEDYIDHTAEAHPDEWGFDFHRNMTYDQNDTGRYSTELYANEAVNIINKHNQTEPLFLYLPFQAVHSANPTSVQLQAPAKYVDRFLYIKNMKRRIFAGMVSAMDDAVGHVVSALKSRGMYENSIIVFSTDNGGPSNGFDYNAASNWPLRGVKATLWEGGVRGDGFIHSPLLHKTGYISKQMLDVCDWLPTLYSAAGGNSKDLHNLDGVDQWSVLSNNEASKRSEILHNIDPRNKFAGIRVGDYKLVMGDISYGGAWSGWYPPWTSPEGENQNMNDVHKFSMKSDDMSSNENEIFDHLTVQCGIKPANASTNCDSVKAPCLYHILSDPCEYHNIAAQNPNIVQSLLDRLHYYNATMVPPGNLPIDPKGNPRYHNGYWVPWITL